MLVQRYEGRLKRSGRAVVIDVDTALLMLSQDGQDRKKFIDSELGFAAQCVGDDILWSSPQLVFVKEA